MPIGSGGQYYADEGALLVDTYGPMTDKQKSDRKEIDANESAGSFKNRFPDRPVVYISPNAPDVEDRRGMGTIGSMLSGVTPESIMQKGMDILKYGPSMSGLERGQAINAETVPPETELSKQLGTSDIRMPLGSSTEPAGALKPEGSTQVPGPSAPRLKVGDITPEGETVAHTTASPLVNITHEDIERGINVALSSGAGTIAGVKSKVADTDKLLDAFVMAGQRESPSKIFRKTGWYQGHEGKWKYEIDDSKALFDRKWAEPEEDFKKALALKGVKNPPALTQKLGKIYDHPDLYKAYPDLKDLKVTSDPNYKGVAEYSTTTDSIRMNPEHAGDQSILAHEIQHAIQQREGFAKGGSWGEAGKDYELKYTEATQALIPEADTLLNKMHEEGLKSEEWDRLKHLQKLFETHGAYKEAGDAEAKQYYMRMAGEIEARNVERRLYMTAKERSKVIPRSTEIDEPAGMNPIVVNEPAYTSAYGVIHPETGLPMKAEPTEFRRAANENEKPMDMSPLTDALRKHFYETVTKPHEEFIKKYDELHALGEKSSKWTELDRARYNKLGREINPDWEDVK